MSSAANTFLRLNSTVSQPGSPTSLKGAERVSMVGSVVGGGGATSVGIGTQSVTGTAKGRAGRCGSACWRYLSSNPRLRKGLAHAGLVLLLCLYTAAGASVRTQQPASVIHMMIAQSVSPLFPEPGEFIQPAGPFVYSDDKRFYIDTYCVNRMYGVYVTGNVHLYIYISETQLAAAESVTTPYSLYSLFYVYIQRARARSLTD